MLAASTADTPISNRSNNINILCHRSTDLDVDLNINGRYTTINNAIIMINKIGHRVRWLWFLIIINHIDTNSSSIASIIQTKTHYSCLISTALSINNTPSKWSISCWTITASSHDNWSCSDWPVSLVYWTVICLYLSTCQNTHGSDRHHSSSRAVASLCDTITGLIIMTVDLSL